MTETTDPALRLWRVQTVTGDLDGLGAARLRMALAEALLAGERHLLIDLAGVAFIDSIGIGVLVGAAKRATDQGGRLRLAAASPAVERLLGITGLDHVLGSYPTVEEARAAPLDQP